MLRAPLETIALSPLVDQYLDFGHRVPAVYMLYLALSAYDDHANKLARIDRHDGVLREVLIARVARLDEVPEIPVIAQVSEPGGRVFVEEVR